MSSPVSRSVTVHLARVNLTGDPHLLQVVANRLSTDPFDPELPQLADDARVAEPRRRRDLDHQLADLTRLALTAFGIQLLLARRLIAAPAVKGRGRDQRDQFLDHLAQRLTQLDQPGSLVGLRVNLAGERTGRYSAKHLADRFPDGQ